MIYAKKTETQKRLKRNRKHKNQITRVENTLKNAFSTPGNPRKHIKTSEKANRNFCENSPLAVTFARKLAVAEII